MPSELETWRYIIIHRISNISVLLGACGGMSMEVYEDLSFESEVYLKLKEAESKTELNKAGYTTSELLESLKP